MPWVVIPTYRMEKVIKLLILFVLPLIGGCISGIFPDECEIGGIETKIHSGFGTPIPDTVTLEKSETYRYNLMNSFYLADYEGGGRITCPVGNRRMLAVDSLISEPENVVKISIEQDSMLTIVGKNVGHSLVKVYLKTRLENYNRIDSVGNEFIVE